ncbi:MCE family protein [Mycobacterium koreense]|uniref:Mammalian cell entry protein n=1 Tax=Mycolicibacillus koreensis TaxID=1069220 RepID=A0A7I7SHJ4_9MYCO|nr:MCE family protein [Mycolicibacillus koreensis]MCV7247238.1 MCE family protein [Mycolicibacillus koreensis]ODR06665.1 mammalian cell entry protein [Mycolicibacillus koreensis]OSC34241.1 mammalian cell entry protein [Mycolicibacillus koreensis]BBY56427.1 mammalian cell entry protein [Mycolicibacillus koreensis]
MHRYRGNKLVRTGFIGLVVMILIINVGMKSQQLLTLATAIRYHALFSEAGGLAVGNDVKVSGVTVGSVTDIALEGGSARVTFALSSKIRLGTDTTAHIRTGTLLGERILTLEPSGDGRIGAAGVIPLSRTGSPYSLTDAVGDFAANTADTDTASINDSLDVLSEVIDRIAPQVGPTLDGVTRLSRSLNERDTALADLLKSAASVTGVLSERSNQVNALILNANDLVGVLQSRRYAVVNLLANTSTVARELSTLVAENEEQLAPTLEQLNRVLSVLERNRDNIADALTGLAKYQITQGEAVNSGFYYYGFASNLLPGPAIQPFLDYALGFRRGVNAGQPPDNAGPRSEFPFPYNGIPGG